MDGMEAGRVFVVIPVGEREKGVIGFSGKSKPKVSLPHDVHAKPDLSLPDSQSVVRVVLPSLHMGYRFGPSESLRLERSGVDDLESFQVGHWYTLW